METHGIGCIPLFKYLLVGLLQVLWALDNIAALHTSIDSCDHVLDCKVLQPLAEQLREGSELSVLRNATWTLSNLCLGTDSLNGSSQVCLILP